MNNQWRENANKMVVWADGTYDTGRRCDECSRHDCHAPVHQDRYREIGESKYLIEKDVEIDSPVGYWDWLSTNRPFGAKQDFDGEMVFNEPIFANPDALCMHNQDGTKCDYCQSRVEKTTRSSGITIPEDALARQAYQHLTSKQRQVWDLVMREQISQVHAAERLGITQQAVNKHLQAAIVRVTEYIKEHHASA